MIGKKNSKPAASYEEAMQRVKAFRALDDTTIRPEAYTRVFEHGSQSDIAVVLYHGFTNHPGQYVEFAPMLFQRGMNVFIPRLPEQGDKDRMTTRLANLTAEELLTSASEALDIAQGLGRHVVILGISTSGLLCAYFAQYRGDVARAIIVAPLFGLLRFSHTATSVIGAVARRLPNRMLWWDPRHKMDILPSTGYPRFPTRGLAQTLLIADDVYAASRKCSPAAESAVLVTNRRDPAVNNAVADRVVERWNARRPGFAEIYCFDDLPVNHDIIDPQNAAPRTDLVYPKLLELTAS
ncbi:MAG: alpha/beta hydrolase [Candidatus Eremiobacteraeota bacterium]|nr:alpha/beta hydrolase [Candidatus Eremiobacteraeota bacterium]